jgi:hypothetical protein
MTRPNEQYAYFTVSGEFDPETITKALKLEPTEAWKKGDRNETTHYERKFSRWSLHSRLPHFDELESHIRDVLNQLASRTEQVRSLVQELGVGGIECVGHFHASYPGFTLAKDIISAMANLNLELDCDFYYMYSDRRDDS